MKVAVTPAMRATLRRAIEELDAARAEALAIYAPDRTAADQRRRQGVLADWRAQGLEHVLEACFPDLFAEVERPFAEARAATVQMIEDLGAEGEPAAEILRQYDRWAPLKRARAAEWLACCIAGCEPPEYAPPGARLQ